MSIRGLRHLCCVCLAVLPWVALAGPSLDEIRALVSARQWAEAEAALSAQLPAQIDPAQADPATLRLLAMRARTLSGQGRRPEALTLREALVPAMEARLGETDFDTLAELRSLAAHYYYFDRLDEALRTARVAAVRSRLAFGPEHRLSLMAESTLAQLMAAQGNPEAAAWFALKVLERGRNSRQAPEFLDSLRFSAAQSLRAARRYEEAVPLFRESYEYRRATHGAERQDTLDAGVQLAWTLSRVGQDELALDFARELAERAEASLGRSAESSLWAASVYAELLGRSQRYEDAMALYARTLARLAGQSTGKLYADTITLAIEHGLEAGDASACAHLSSLLATAREASADSTLRANAVASSAYCRVLAGDLRDGRERLEAALAQAPDTPGSEIDRARLQQRLAALLIADGEPDQARGLLVAAQQQAEALRARSPLLRRGGLADWVEDRPWLATTRTLVRLLAEAGEAQAAFAVAESIKARRLIELAERNQDIANLPAPQADAARQARQTLEAAQFELALALDGGERALAEARVAQAEQDLARLLRPALASPTLPAPRSDEVFVHLVADGPDLVVLARDAQGTRGWITRLGDAEPLVAAARRALGVERQANHLWRLPNGRLIEQPLRPPGPAQRVRDGEALLGFAAALAPAVQPAVAAGQRVMVSADSAYAWLPLEALPWNGSRLGLLAQIAYAHSAAWAERTRSLLTRPQASGGLVSIGVESPRLAREGLDWRLAQLDWPRLPGVQAETEAIARHLAAWPVTHLTDAQAGAAGLQRLARQGGLASARWIHIAAHAWFSDASPELSSLVLGDVEQAPASPTRGYLTAAELRSWDLRAELVVLSACTSAGSGNRAGEGLSGLVHAILSAGAAGSIVSLWPVEDRATAALMDGLYRGIAAGAAPDAALAQARRSLAAQGYPPRDWAGFVYYGAPR